MIKLSVKGRSFCVMPFSVIKCPRVLYGLAFFRGGGGGGVFFNLQFVSCGGRCCESVSLLLGS